MSTLEIFDRPLCCSSGICGPAVDPVLVRFAADLDWLRGLGVQVHRYNLAFEPAAFTRHEDVKEALRAGQVSCLPLVRVAGRVVSQGRYPGREDLAAWCGVADQLQATPAPAACCTPGCCS